MKKFYCDKCKQPIEEAVIDSMVYKLDATVMINYQMAKSEEYHFHKECWEKIRGMFN